MAGKRSGRKSSRNKRAGSSVPRRPTGPVRPDPVRRSGSTTPPSVPEVLKPLIEAAGRRTPLDQWRYDRDSEQEAESGRDGWGFETMPNGDLYLWERRRPAWFRRPPVWVASALLIVAVTLAIWWAA
jgi:hypothetical protein